MKIINDGGPKGFMKFIGMYPESDTAIEYFESLSNGSCLPVEDGWPLCGWNGYVSREDVSFYVTEIMDVEEEGDV